MPTNIDLETVKGFGEEWSTFTQEDMTDSERAEIFAKYFCLVDWSTRPARALDMGCGSGRWDVLVAPHVGELVVADASAKALQVARRNVQATNVSFVECTPDSLPFPDGYFDFVFSLGVLHHLPDTGEAIRSLASKLCPGGLILLYLYYAFDNRPRWYRALWRVSDGMRRTISRLPFLVRYILSQLIAVLIYWPLARIAKYVPVPEAWPLKFYSDRSFHAIRTDALDRFGTRLERRFTREEIREMLAAAGLTEVRFSESTPYWVCTAIKP